MNNRLYNVFFPVWLLIFFPPIILAVLPINLAIDFIVLALTMKYLHIAQPWQQAKKVIMKTWLCGFVADIIGAALMFSTALFDYMNKEGASSQFVAVFWNTSDNIYAFLWTVMCVAFTSVLIYLANYYFCLKKINLDKPLRRRVALSLAVFTAPYVFLVPTTFVYKIIDAVVLRFS